MSAPPRVWVGSFADDTRVQVRGESGHHLARVLRVRAGDAVVAFDGAGHEARATVASVEGRGEATVTLVLTETPRAGTVADRADVYWLQGVPKGDKLDSVLRQATELGARAIWPVYTARSVARPSGDPTARAERWRAIARSASGQCGRADVPEVREAAALDEALRALPSSCALRLVPWEEGGEPLRAVLSRTPAGSPCAVLVGPEGGLASDEIALAREHGFVPVTLGPRILRTETVAPALLGMLSLARGDLSGS